MHKYFIGSLLFLFTFTTSYAQKAYIEGGTIEEQLQFIQNKSSRWENYTMLPDPWFKLIKENTLDTLKSKNSEIIELIASINQKDIEINDLTEELKSTQETLTKTEKEKESFTLFNIEMSKVFFISLISSVFIVLLIIAIGAILLFKKENIAIRRNKNEHDQLKQDFEDYRQDVRKKQEQLVIQHHKEMQKLKGMG